MNSLIVNSVHLESSSLCDANICRHFVSASNSHQITDHQIRHIDFQRVAVTNHLKFAIPCIASVFLAV